MTGDRRRRFEQMYADHRGPVLGYVLRRTRNPDDAADVVKPEITALPLVERCPQHQEPIGDGRHCIACDEGVF